MKNPIRVLVADDHSIVRAGIATVLGLYPDVEVIGEASNGRIAVQKAKELRPDVVLMDLMMPVLDGVSATQAIVQDCPETKVLVLTTYGFSNDIAMALEAGACGALIKTASNTSLVASIRATAAGKRVIAPELQRLINSDAPVEKLTQRQLEILQSLVRGLTNQDMATQFGISLDGVKQHVRGICAKLGAANRAEAVGIALRKHLLKM